MGVSLDVPPLEQDPIKIPLRDLYYEYEAIAGDCTSRSGRVGGYRYMRFNRTGGEEYGWAYVRGFWDERPVLRGDGGGRCRGRGGGGLRREGVFVHVLSE